jgi:hypothetical protein
VHGVVLEEIAELVDLGEVVYTHDLEPVIGNQLFEGASTDATESVDGYPCHVLVPSSACSSS